MANSATRSTFLSAGSAIVSVAVAMSCCLPTGALLAAVGLAGASPFLSQAQPYLLGLAVLSLAIGAVMALRAKQCAPSRRRINLAILAVSAVLVVPVLAFPQQTAAFLADSVLPRGGPPAGQPRMRVLDVAQLRREFNEAAGQRRVIALFSPT